MEINELLELKSSYQRQKLVLGNVLASALCYWSDVQLLAKTLWQTEREIIGKSGTIYNGL